MKTFEEACEEGHSRDDGLGVLLIIDKAEYKQIQLGAYHQACTDMAELVVNEQEMQPITQSERNTMLACKTAILTARDNKKEI